MSFRSLSLRIALRYLFSKKSHAAVNVLSYISMAGVAVAAAAMVIVLSVFNGFSDFTARKMSNFTPPLKITSSSGALINDADSVMKAAEAVRGVSVASPVITQRAFAVTDDYQSPVVICGVAADGPTYRALSNAIIDGRPSLYYDVEGIPNTAIASVGVANALRTFPAVPVNVKIYEPRRHTRMNPANPLAAFRCDSLVVNAVYRIDENEYDSEYIFVPLQFARNLLSYDAEATSIEIDTAPGADVEAVAGQLRSCLGPGYVVANRLEQQQEAFRMINVEKWITMVMLTFILVVATFNVLSIMSIMILEKRSNRNIFIAMGATGGMISGIFGWLSMLTTAIGGVIGVIFGVTLSLLQQLFGFIKLGAADPSQLSIDVYPVSVNPVDIVVVIAIIIGVGGLTAAVTRLFLGER